jgi:hypothetical protein
MNIYCDTSCEDAAHSAKVRQLNDAFRRSLVGGAVMITTGIIALGAEAQAAVIARVRAFDDFSADNDPWCEHDMGAFEITLVTPGGDSATTRILWKIDYFDKTRTWLSPNAADPTVTVRMARR